MGRGRSHRRGLREHQSGRGGGGGAGAEAKRGRKQRREHQDSNAGEGVMAATGARAGEMEWRAQWQAGGRPGREEERKGEEEREGGLLLLK